MSELNINDGQRSISGGSSNPLVSWVKKNKPLAVALGGAGALLFLSSKGSAEGGETADAEDAGLDTTATERVLVPIAGASSEEAYNDEWEGATLDDLINRVEDLEERPKPKPDNPANPNHDGITIRGKKFPGATSSQIVGAQGDCVKYLIIYPGKNEKWMLCGSKWRKEWASDKGPGGNGPQKGNKPKGGKTPGKPDKPKGGKVGAGKGGKGDKGKGGNR